MTETEITRFTYKFFDRNSNTWKKDKNDWVFNKVMKFELPECDSEFTLNDFKKYFFDKNVFSQEWKKLNNAIEKSKVIYLHSYGKNGKSTFLRYYLESRESSVSRFEIINFSTLNKYWAPNLNYRLRDHLKSLFYQILVKDDKPYILKFFKSLLEDFNIRSHIPSYRSPRITEYIELVSLLFKKKNLNTSYTNTEKKFDYHQFIIDLFHGNHLPNEFLLCTLISYTCFKHAKYLGSSELIIALDDLDDVFTYLPEKINQVLTMVVFQFIHELQISFTSIFKCKDGQKLDLKFLFVYRTSNFLSSIYTDISKNEQSRLQFYKSNASKVRLSSVQEPFGIYKKRIDFYLTLCSINKIRPSQKAYILQIFLEIVREFDSDYKYIYLQRIFRLWNGNKFRLTEFILGSDFTDNELEIILENGKRINSNIKINIFYNKIVKYFTRVETGNTLTEFMEYSIHNFESDQEKGQCSLARLFFTFVYNERNKNKSIESIPDSYHKGISLYSFISEIEKIRKNGSPAYNQDEIIELFTSLFSFEIDNWGNFFSCVTATDIRNLNQPIEYYKFTRELRNILKSGKKLEKVKFFYNDSAPYFMFQLKRSFEYFSVCENYNNPLLCDLKVSILKDGKFNSNFEQTLNNVFSRVKICTIITIEFYQNCFSHLSIQEYINSSFTYNNKFYFDDLISKIITYIENVRYSAVSNKIKIKGDYPNLNSDEQSKCKQFINKTFITNIEKYLNLFFSLFNKIEEINAQSKKDSTLIKSFESMDMSIPHSLLKTNTAFQNLKNLIKDQKAKNYKDFISRITID